MKNWKKLVCFLLLGAMLVSLCACRGEEPAPRTGDLMADVEAREPAPQATQGSTAAPQSGEAVTQSAARTPYAAAAANFAVGLLQGSAAGTDNCVLSPYSAMLALAMTANGAQGETLAQMEAVLGLPVGVLNEALRGCDMGEGVVSANSVWLRDTDELDVKDAFLQANADYFGAGVYRAPFDAQTVEDVNAWVSEHTAGRIPQILTELDPQTMLLLVNALTFDARWMEEYDDYQVTAGEFHAADGTQQSASFLHSTEHTYLDDGMATGFLKPYSGGRYSFLALLPNEGVSMQDYLASLTGETLLATVENASRTPVDVRLPKFTAETSEELSAALAAMGMPLAFTADADFSGIADLPLIIGGVLQKTWIEVTESGTTAAAATVIVMEKALALEERPKVVELDRPFVMGIYDNETQSFLFLGAINQVGD